MVREERGVSLSPLMRPPVKDAFAAIMRRWGVHPSEVTSRDQSRRATRARRIVALELRAMGYTMVEVASVLKRHHTTVVAMLGRCGARSREDLDA